MELKNKKIAFLGDSITEGHGVADKNNIYCERMRRECSLRDIYVDGIGGTRIARQTVPSENERYDKDFISRVDKIDKDADIVVVFGGTNDFGHGDAQIGSENDDTPYTFYGACNILCTKLIERFPSARIVFMGPLHRLHENSLKGSRKTSDYGTLYDYVDVLKKVTRKYSIPFLDLLSVGGITPFVKIQQDMYMPDGLHPNDDGHAKICEKLKGFLTSL